MESFAMVGWSCVALASGLSPITTRKIRMAYVNRNLVFTGGEPPACRSSGQSVREFTTTHDGSLRLLLLQILPQVFDCRFQNFVTSIDRSTNRRRNSNRWLYSNSL